jgi:biopolymer transport protein ExbB
MYGGWIMAVLFVLSIVAVALFIERWMAVKRALKFEERIYIDILGKIDERKSSEAAKVCKLSESAICKILEQGLEYADKDLLLAQETIEQNANQFIRGLEKNLSTIATLAAIAPLIGFLGTVTGMIRTFMDIAAAGQIDIQNFSGGIWEALITTVGGLIVGILCIVFYNFLTAKIEGIAFFIEGKISQVGLHLRRGDR